MFVAFISLSSSYLFLSFSIAQFPFPLTPIHLKKVYNFQPTASTGNNSLLISQLRKAIEPHERFIPLAMTQVEMSRRVLAWLEKDWAEVVRAKMKEDAGFWGSINKDFLL